MGLETRTRHRARTVLLATTALASAMMLSATAIAQIATSQPATPTQNTTRIAVRNYAIAGGPLADVLNRFADVSQLQLIYSGAVTRGRRSGGINGAFTPQQALAQLLVGSGLSHRFTAANAVTIFDPASASASMPPPPDGSIMLDPIEVSAHRSGGFTADTPYQTPGSSAYISREQLDRIPPNSPGDVFINTPGVISGGNKVGTSINPNIRGLQGMGRVVTTVDGARQTASSYRGYIGNRDETYVDPDLIGGIDISKGPSSGVGTGGIGGTVNFRTLAADDILTDGKSWGVRVRGGAGNNTVGPRALPSGPGLTTEQVTNTSVATRPSYFDPETFSGSAAAAVKQEHFELTAAYSRKRQGNYFVGTKIPEGIVFAPDPNKNALILPGQEAWNTSQDTESALVKGKVKWGDGQSLELGYVRYNSHYGLVNELALTFNQQTGIVPYGQFPLSHTQVNTYTAKYEYQPTGNDLVNLRANLWFSDLATVEQENFQARYGMRTLGTDIGNRSRFDTAFGSLTWDNGVEVVREHANAVQFPSTVTYSQGWETLGPSGTRLLTGTFSKADLELTRWLTISGGIRYDHYQSEGEGYLTKFPKRSDGRLSPHAAIVLTPVTGLQLFGKYTEGYRAPSLRETHWHYQGLLWNNPFLDGEVAKNAEVGFNILREGAVVRGDRLRFKAAFFDNHTDNYIVRMRGITHNGVPLPGDDPTRYHWYNIDDAHFRGFEVSGSYDAGKFFLEAGFNKYIEVKFCDQGVCVAPASSTAPAVGALRNDYATNYIPPDYSGSVTMGLRFFDQALTVGGRAYFASARIGAVWPPDGQGVIGSGTHSWPKYNVFDVFASYKVTRDAILNLSVENITDEYYFGALTSTGIPSPGRTGRMSFNVVF